MAEVTINGLPLGAALAGTEEIPIWQSSGTKKTSVASIVAMAQRVPINNQSGTSYTIALADIGGVVRQGNAAPCTLTIPLNSTTAFPVGSVVPVRRTGEGSLTIAATGGVTLNIPTGFLATIAMVHGTAMLHKVGTNEWDLSGDLTIDE